MRKSRVKSPVVSNSEGSEEEVGDRSLVQRKTCFVHGFFKKGWYPTWCARKIVTLAQMLVFMSLQCWGVRLVSNTRHSESR